MRKHEPLSAIDDLSASDSPVILINIEFGLMDLATYGHIDGSAERGFMIIPRMAFPERIFVEPKKLRFLPTSPNLKQSGEIKHELFASSHADNARLDRH